VREKLVRALMSVPKKSPPVVCPTFALYNIFADNFAVGEVVCAEKRYAVREILCHPLAARGAGKMDPQKRRVGDFYPRRPTFSSSLILSPSTPSPQQPSPVLIPSGRPSFLWSGIRSPASGPLKGLLSLSLVNCCRVSLVAKREPSDPF